MNHPHTTHHDPDRDGDVHGGDDPVQAAALDAAAAMDTLETLRAPAAPDLGVAAWPQLRWVPTTGVDIGQMWCFWCDRPMMFPVERAWHVVNPEQVFGDADAPLTYLHAECVPALYRRQRLVRAHHQLRRNHHSYQHAVTAAYGAHGENEPSPDQHARLADLARATADAAGALLACLDEEPLLGTTQPDEAGGDPPR
ncbi:hypothetical protein [Pseudonocardia sp. NPDC049635]|uniref:hypothetical protein n=1 Tax=Pseudonocardia sp. NPDC049635 TaxID=3155506 RepID=UPI0033C3C8ED